MTRSFKHSFYNFICAYILPSFVLTSTCEHYNHTPTEKTKGVTNGGPNEAREEATTGENEGEGVAEGPVEGERVGVPPGTYKGNISMLGITGTAIFKDTNTFSVTIEEQQCSEVEYEYNQKTNDIIPIGNCINQKLESIPKVNASLKSAKYNAATHTVTIIINTGFRFPFPKTVTLPLKFVADSRIANMRAETKPDTSDRRMGSGESENRTKLCLNRNESNCNNLSKNPGPSAGYKDCVWNSRKEVCFPSKLSSNTHLAKQYIKKYRKD
jgi:hypothetical protein